MNEEQWHNLLDALCNVVSVGAENFVPKVSRNMIEQRLFQVFDLIKYAHL